MLTEKQASEITRFMRVVNYLQNHLHIIGDNEQLMSTLADSKKNLDAVFEQLEQEDRDALLERYTTELEMLGLNKTLPDDPA